MEQLDLNKIRQEIDRVDESIVELYKKRMGLCEDVAEYKISAGKPVLDRTRETQKISKVCDLTTNEFDMRSVEELFKQLMSISRKLQYRILSEHGLLEELSFEMVEEVLKENVKVVFQGLEGAYAHDATCQFFGEKSDIYHVESWRDAMEEVKSGRADYAVLPIENSTAGAISQVHDILIEYDNYIVGETSVKVEHALLGVPGASMDDIKVVYSHPQSLMQCSKFLDDNRNWNRISLSNNAVSAKKVSDEKDITQAAIASERAAKIYGLEVLQKKINYEEGNTTRFVIIGHSKIYTRNADRVSVCFEIPHEAGSLYNIMSHFIYNHLSMTKIESRPIEGRKWEYRFFVDIEGNLGDVAVRNALIGIKEEAINFTVLGNY